MSGALTISRESAASAEIFAQAVLSWGIELSPSEREAYAAYAELLVEWNSTKFNLTRLVTPEQIALNHFLDSVVLSQLVKVPAKCTLIDIGTGAGFPGLAFKVIRRDIKLVLIESTAKKLTFCRAVADELALTNIDFIHGRAEDRLVLTRFARKASIVTARAVAPLKTLLEWTAPYVAPGGIIVAWKGTKVHEEVSEAQHTASRLGLKLDIIERTLTVPGLPPLNHYYVICRKSASA